MTTITTADPIFGNVAATTGAPFLNDVVTLINESPSLIAEINAIDALPTYAGGQTTVSLQANSAEGGSASYRSTTINISSLTSYDESTKPYLSGSFTSSQDSVTPAAVFVGILAHEGEHYLDAQAAGLFQGGNLSGMSIDQALVTEFASEGKAAYGQYAQKAQIDGANGGTGTAYFEAANTLQQSSDELRLVARITDQGQAESYLGSQFWDVHVGSGTYLSTYWSYFGAQGTINYLGISEATITNVTEQTNDSGVLVGATIQTATLDYSFTYSGTGVESVSVTNSAGMLQYTEAFNATGSTVYDLSRYQSGGIFTQTTNANETVYGNSNNVTDSGTALGLQGDHNDLIHNAQAANDFLTGNANDLFDQAASGSTLELNLAGASDIIVLGSSAANLTGSATGSEVFGGTGALDWLGNGGTLILDGSATIDGSSASTVVFGGSGAFRYNGTGGYDDVIASTGSATIQAGSGGGWYEGGTNGHNLITGSNSGLGTILAAGGHGATIQGGTSGGYYFLAATGNETLLGGNAVGTQTMFLGSGSDVVETGTASSIIDTSTGSALINDFGSTIVYGGTGQADTFTAAAGHMDVVGFRAGTDHVTGSIASAAIQGSNTVLHLSDGASITLIGVQTATFT